MVLIAYNLDDNQSNYIDFSGTEGYPNWIDFWGTWNRYSQISAWLYCTNSLSGFLINAVHPLLISRIVVQKEHQKEQMAMRELGNLYWLTNLHVVYFQGSYRAS